MSIEELAKKLLEILLSQYSVSGDELLKLVPPELLESVVILLIRRYGWKYDFVCESSPPAILFYGARPRIYYYIDEERLDEDERTRRCLAMVQSLREEIERRALERCKDRLVYVNGRLYMRITDNLFIDDEFLFVRKSGGELRKNMSWRLLYRKYRDGYRNPFVRWFGEKLEEARPCVELLLKLYAESRSLRSGEG